MQQLLHKLGPSIAVHGQRGVASLAMFRKAQQYAGSAIAEERERIAIVDESGPHTYAQLVGDAGRVRRCLGAAEGGNLGGASVAMLIPNSYEYAAVQWGIWAAGGSVVPLSPMHPQRELEYFIANSEARTVICHPTLLPSIDAAVRELHAVRIIRSDTCMSAETDTMGLDDVDVDETQSALFIYTSGTTGRPKGVVHTHASIGAQVSALCQAWQWTTSDRLLHVLPLHHIHGIVVALCAALWSGATTEMLPRFDKDRVWDRLIDGPQDISVLMGVPTMYARLLAALDEMPAERQMAARAAVGRLRLTVSGSAALPASVFARWQDATGQAMLERYGMSEIGMALSNDAAQPATRQPGSVGMPLPGVHVRLMDADGVDVTCTPGSSGMIQVKGPNVFREYYGMPEKTAAEFTPDGWFITGDVATRSADGLYRIMGRQSVDIIKSGGFKLSALEIERELLEHPSVADVAVVGVPSEDWGEAVAAAAVLSPGAEPLELGPLTSWCYQRMARYKAPKSLLVVDALPRNLMGKLDKSAVKAMFS